MQASACIETKETSKPSRTSASMCDRIGPEPASPSDDGRAVLMTRVLHAPALGEAETAERIARAFTQAGVGERVTLGGALPWDELLRVWAGMDLALMPFPYGGGVSLLEALWMGVPAISLAGESFAARHGASHLGVLGLDDWVAASEEAYVARAVTHASDLGGLSRLRAELRSRLRSSALCDARGFARAFERALRQVSRRT